MNSAKMLMDGSAPPRRLLDQVRDAMRLKHYSYWTEQSYVQGNACGRTMSRLRRKTPSSEITLSSEIVVRAATMPLLKSIANYLLIRHTSQPKSLAQTVKYNGKT